VVLAWEGKDPFGTPLRLKATVAHEPSLPADGGTRLTPDVVLTVEGGRPGKETRTVHVLDAKLRDEPFRLAREVARNKYHAHLVERPMGSYVILPVAASELWKLLLFMPDEEKASMATGTGAHGFAWGCLQARPGSRTLGIRQFLAIALQYHRWEFRNVCSNCGGVVGLRDMDFQPAENDTRTFVDVAEAHRDTTDAEGMLLAHGRLTYACTSCGHRWSRQTCPRGHLLMKHGQLTPHPKRKGLPGDPDYNVVCCVCGDAMGPPRSTGDRW